MDDRPPDPYWQIYIDESWCKLVETDCWFVNYDATFLAKTISMSFIVTVGVVGNLLLGLTILWSRRLRAKSVNLFIANLSLSNLVNLLLIAPAILVDSETEFFVLGEFMCHTLRVAQTIFFIVPMINLLTIGFDRYLALRYPFTLQGSHRCTTVTVTAGHDRHGLLSVICCYPDVRPGGQ